ncbi:MAG: NADP-dependent oxidoreductase [Pseudomonadota bacterium]
MTCNRQWLIDGNPHGRAVRTSDFRLSSSSLAPLAGEQLRIRVDYLEFTPSLKGQMENRLAYAQKTRAGEVMRGRGLGTVVESRCTQVPTGARVLGYLGWQEYATLELGEITVLPDDRFTRHHLGPLGSTGMAAYFGLFDAGRPNPGDVVLISAAAGAVGSMVGQMAKLSECRVIGVAGGPMKCRHLCDILGLHEAIDYREEDLPTRLRECAPEGVNVVFDNVGGDFLQAALGHLAVGARVVICGAISRYEAAQAPPGPSNYFNLVHKRATMQGILSVDYRERFPEAVAKIRAWLESGEFTYVEDIQQGFENIPAAFLRLFSGQNLGKQLLRLQQVS